MAIQTVELFDRIPNPVRARLRLELHSTAGTAAVGQELPELSRTGAMRIAGAASRKIAAVAAGMIGSALRSRTVKGIVGTFWSRE
jgi:hypothetical protein